ncbi:hypothetical protein P153DRAFT_263017, partial [Dothidotthia symphoricarpi CBS 119687]
LHDLPDELLLEIFSSLECIRSYEPQYTAFTNKEKERTRQRENKVRQLTLYSLCLTSRRFRVIATPILYTSCTSTATWHSSKSLASFHKTISAPGTGYGLTTPLANCLRYVENRFSDHLGNSLEHDSGTVDATDMLGQHFFLLSDIITKAPNLQHISVVNIESGDMPFWRHLIPLEADANTALATTKIASHGFPKLRTLCIQIHSLDTFGKLAEDAVWFQHICTALATVPSLSELRASDISTHDMLTVPSSGYQNLQRLELTMCCLNMQEVGTLLHACLDLRHFSCIWSACYVGEAAFADLRSGLLQHEKSLRTLVLDMREMIFDFVSSIYPQPLGSLHSLVALETLVICECSLLEPDSWLFTFLGQKSERRVAELLPENIEDLTVLLRNDGHSDVNPLDEAPVLWHLIEDCNVLLPKLRNVNLEMDHTLSTDRLQAAFNDANIEF